MSIFKKHLYQLAAYKPPLDGRDPHKNTLLDFNERTLPVGPAISNALISYINEGRLQMYPAYGDIVNRIADYAGVEDNQLMITNGSDHGIELIFRATCSPGDEVIIPQPSFAMYRQCALIENTTIIEPHFSFEAGFPIEACLAAISAKTRVVCVASPNNPSGTGVTREDIIRLAEAAPKACILVDECYFEYSQMTVVDCVAAYPNIIITRTFSKTWGIPSLRMGYLIAASENITALLSVRGPYDINQLAVVAAKAALENPEYTQEYVSEVMQVSKPLLESYLKAKQIKFWPSVANYLWMFVSDVQKVEKHLQDANILVRPKADSEGVMGLRVTLGTKAQTESLIASLDEVLH